MRLDHNSGITSTDDDGDSLVDRIRRNDTSCDQTVLHGTVFATFPSRAEAFDPFLGGEVRIGLQDGERGIAGIGVMDDFGIDALDANAKDARNFALADATFMQGEDFDRFAEGDALTGFAVWRSACAVFAARAGVSAFRLHARILTQCKFFHTLRPV